jgi:TPR repeat protein
MFRDWHWSSLKMAQKRFDGIGLLPIRGDPEAQRRLAVCYEYGRFIATDVLEAFQ